MKSLFKFLDYEHGKDDVTFISLRDKKSGHANNIITQKVFQQVCYTNYILVTSRTLFKLFGI